MTCRLGNQAPLHVNETTSRPVLSDTPMCHVHCTMHGPCALYNSLDIESLPAPHPPPCCQGGEGGGRRERGERHGGGGGDRYSWE